MRFLIAAVTVCLLAVVPQPATKPNMIPPVVLEEPLSIPDIPDIDVVLGDPVWAKAVYKVRVMGTNGRGQTADGAGSGVGVTTRKLHTAKHLRQGLFNYHPEVLVGEEWKRGRWTESAEKDLAVIEVDFDIDYVPVRVPKYGEHVTVYGLKTKSFAQGRYAGDFNPTLGSGYAPLDACEMPTELGDSGGGVFGDDGYLLGTISGSPLSAPLVVSFVPIVEGKPLAAAAPAATPTPALQGNCANGMCPAPTYQGQQWKRRR